MTTASGAPNWSPGPRTAFLAVRSSTRFSSPASDSFNGPCGPEVQAAVQCRTSATLDASSEGLRGRRGREDDHTGRGERERRQRGEAVTAWRGLRAWLVFWLAMIDLQENIVFPVLTISTANASLPDRRPSCADIPLRF